MPKYNKGFINPYQHSLVSNSPEEMFDYTMTNLMDNFYRSAMNTAIDGTFKAVCLSGMDTGDGTGQGTGATDAVVSSEFLNIIVRPLTDFGNIIPDPRLFNDGKKITEAISMHAASFTARSDFAFDVTNPIEFGQIVDCYFEKGSVSNSDFRTLRFSNPPGKIIEVSYQQLQLVEGFQPLSSFFGAGGGMLLGFSGPAKDNPNHIMRQLERQVQPSTELVVGIGSLTAVAQAQIELAFWNGKNELDAGRKGSIDRENEAFKRIQLYNYYVSTKGEKNWNDLLVDWKYKTAPEVTGQEVGGSAEGGTGDGVTGIMHWSATSVSWCMRGTGFPKYYGHSGYSGNIGKGHSPSWKMHSLIRERCVAKLGDVVVKPAGHGRGDTALTASHGDIIVSIDLVKGEAKVAGGNIGSRGTFKISGTLKVDSEGVIVDPGSYIVILKKIK